MQPSPVRTHKFAESRDSSIEDDRGHLRRGRPQEKGKAVERSSTPVSRPRESKERFTFGKLGALFGLDNSDDQAGERWKEFKKGNQALGHWHFHVHLMSRNIYLSNIICDTR